MPSFGMSLLLNRGKKPVLFEGTEYYPLTESQL